jgi:hypothetical protein
MCGCGCVWVCARARMHRGEEPELWRVFGVGGHYGVGRVRYTLEYHLFWLLSQQCLIVHSAVS